MKKTVCILFLLSAKLTFGQAPDWAWAAAAGVESSNDGGWAITSDNYGNCYVTGYFSDTATFGSFTLFSNGGTDIFAVKYDSAGDVVWANNAGGGSNDFGNGISVDDSGNCYVTGSLSGPATFGVDTLAGGGFFIYKYDIAGNEVWARQSAGSSSDYGSGIYTDAIGNSYVTGCFMDTAIFSNDTIFSNGYYYDIFIAKYNSAGNLNWVKRAGGTSHDRARGISVDGIGNCYVTGYFGLFGGPAIFENDTLYCYGYNDIFIAKYNTAGNFVWAKRAGGGGYDQAYGISSDKIGNSFISGSFEGTATFDSISVTSNGASDIFIAKYDSAGVAVWAHHAGGSGYDGAGGISSDNNGNCFIAGVFQDTAFFDSTIIQSSGLQDIFVANYDSSGVVNWVQKAGGTTNDVEGASDISNDSNGNCYVTGFFNNTINFGNTSITSSGFADIFTAKIGENSASLVPFIFPSFDQVQIYPNPTVSELNIQYNSPQPIQFTLYNSLGEKIINEILKDKINTVTLSAFSTGIYFYKLTSHNSIVNTGKILKQ